jgi:hypothetical protein
MFTFNFHYFIDLISLYDYCIKFIIIVVIIHFLTLKFYLNFHYIPIVIIHIIELNFNLFGQVRPIIVHILNLNQKNY